LLPVEAPTFVTSRGNDSLPVEVTIDETRSLPVEAGSLPPGAESLPVEATRSLPDLVNTKAIKHNKSITKAKTVAGTKTEVATETALNKFLEELKPEFPDLNCEVEFRKYKLWWSECGKKNKRPRTSLYNWLIKARKISAESDALAESRRASARGNGRLQGENFGRIKEAGGVLGKESDATYMQRLKDSVTQPF
jgi:hypothetical protein